MAQTVDDIGKAEIPSSDVDDENSDLYALDLPLSLAGALATLHATTLSDRVLGPTDIESDGNHPRQQDADGQPGHVSSEAPHSPPFTKSASWHAIDAATMERRANMQAKPELTEQEIAAQELRALKRGLALRRSISRTVYDMIYGNQPLVIPKPWSMSEAPLQRMTEHPFLFEEYLSSGVFSLEVIKVRREYLRLTIRESFDPLLLPQFQNELKRLTLTEKQMEDTAASRLLVDLLLEVFRHVTNKLIKDITADDRTQKSSVSELCCRLIDYSTHPDEQGELIIAYRDIDEMEREHLLWRYRALDDSVPTTSTSSMERPSPVAPPDSTSAASRDSPPAAEICLSPEPISSPPSTKESSLKDPRSLRVRFEEHLPTRSAGHRRTSHKNQPNSSSSPHNSPSCQHLQCEPQKAVRTQRRSHQRDTKMRHLTHPIVMMTMNNGHQSNHPQPRQANSHPLEDRPATARSYFDPRQDDALMRDPATSSTSSRPIHTASTNPSPFPNPFMPLTNLIPPPTMPQAAHLPESSLESRRFLKRRADQSSSCTSDEGIKSARLNSMVGDNTEAQFAPMESREKNVAMGNTVQSSNGGPSARMRAAFAEANRKRDERHADRRRNLPGGEFRMMSQREIKNGKLAKNDSSDSDDEMEEDSDPRFGPP